jgi:hypothetical protein
MERFDGSFLGSRFEIPRNRKRRKQFRGAASYIQKQVGDSLATLGANNGAVHWAQTEAARWGQ